MRSEYFVVLKKEIVDIIRDKRSVISLLMPLIILPLMFTILNTQFRSAQNSENEKVRLSMHDKRLKELFPEDDYDFIVTDTPENEVAFGNADCAVLHEENGLCFAYDSSSLKSTNALNTIAVYLNMVRENAIFEELVGCGGNIEVLATNLYETRVIKPESGYGTSSIFTSLAPTLLIMLILSGGISIAVDSFSGEKDRKTLENILITKVRRSSLYSAKFTNVVLVSLLSTVASLAGYLIAIYFNKDILSIFGESELKLPSFTVIMIILLVTVSTAFFSSALMSFLSVTSRNAKEAQLKASLISAIPSILSLVIMYTENSKIVAGMMFVPILNSIAQIKLTFSGVIDAINITIAIVSNVLYAVIISYISLKLFNQERLLY